MTYILYSVIYGQHAPFLCARDRVQPPLGGGGGLIHETRLPTCMQELELKVQGGHNYGILRY